MKSIKNYLIILLKISLITLIFTNSGFTEELNQKIISTGRHYSGILMKNLKKELKKSIKKGGIVNAIDVCSNRALKITESIPKKCKGIKIKRTTFKYRNINNKPTKFEQEALNYFLKHRKAKFYIQKVKINNQIVYNYYKRLKVAGICLKCHGSPKKMDKNLIEKLKKLYPNDKAVNYKSGDFRGVIKVSIPEKCLN